MNLGFIIVFILLFFLCLYEDFKYLFKQKSKKILEDKYFSELIKGRGISNIRNLVLLLLGFTFPLSVFLSNILVVLLAVLILVEGNLSEKIKKINSSKWMKSILLLWVMYIIYFFIFGSFTETFWLIKRISLLLLLPIFYCSSFSEKTIQKSVFAFL